MMNINLDINFHDFINHHTLLAGDTNTGKTITTSNFIKFLIESLNFNKADIMILDFAPNLKVLEGLRIGGRIKDFYPLSIECKYLPLNEDIIPPRLQASNKKELYENACKNYKLTYQLLEIYNKNPTPVLIINDISIFLHMGSKKYLLESIENAETFLGNSYYGLSIKRNFANLFSLIERKRVEYIIRNIERTIYTKSQP
ncbi:MAG: hypothetical protein ACTSR8_02240 [Promethearchaeota archaeon]